MSNDYLNQITGGMYGGMYGGNAASGSSTTASGSGGRGRYRPSGFGIDSGTTSTGSTYAREPAPILDVKNVKQWEKKVPESGITWNPKIKKYVFRDANGNLKKTSDFGTAFTALGLNEENPAEAMIARNQNFNLQGAAVRYNPNTKSYFFRDPVSGKILTSPSLTTAYNILNPRPITTPVDPGNQPGPDITLPNGTRLKDTGATPPSGYRPTADSPQFYQPVYKPTYTNRAREGYSLFGPSEPGAGGIGALPSPFSGGLPPEQERIGIPSPVPNPVEMSEPVEQGMAYGGLAGLGALHTPFRRK